ncbi:hypothetical protein KKF38_02500 [Patescibacteria group bacterium]|nr:hypothetical protein [Patescibacteria group bacterium]
MPKAQIEFGADVKNAKQNEGGGDSDFEKGEKGKEWSTDVQNKLRDNLKNDIKEQTLDLQKQIPFRTVQRGDTLIAIISAMNRAGALSESGNIYNLRVEFRSEKKEFRNNMLAKDLPDIHPGQKVWVEGGKIIVADEIETLKKKEEKDEKVKSEPEPELSSSPEIKKALALTALSVLGKTLKSDSIGLNDLKTELQSAQKRVLDANNVGVVFEPNDLLNLDLAKTKVGELEAAAEKESRIKVAENSLDILKKFLEKDVDPNMNSKDLENRMQALQNHLNLANEKVNDLEEDEKGGFTEKLAELGGRVQPKLDGLKLKLDEVKDREERVKSENEKAEKLRQRIVENRNKLNSLEKIEEGDSDLGNILSEAINAIGAVLGDVKEEILQGNFSRIDTKEKVFAIEPGQVELSSGASRSASYKTIYSERPKDKKNLLIRFEASDANAVARREGVKIRDVDELFDKGILKKMSEESAVRFWNGKEISKFWKLEPHNNNLRTKLIAQVKIEGQSEWIRVQENGEITNRAGDKLQRGALHPNDLNVIEDKFGILLAKE